MTYAANPANLDSIARHANMTCYRGDIADAAFVQSVFEKERPQWVVNFAAESHVDRSINNPELFIHSNVLGVSVLMDACLRFGVNRFHQVSTDEVYGDLPLESTSAFTEESALHPPVLCRIQSIGRFAGAFLCQNLWTSDYYFSMQQ